MFLSVSLFAGAFALGRFACAGERKLDDGFEVVLVLTFWSLIFAAIGAPFRRAIATAVIVPIVWLVIVILLAMMLSSL